jgi:hypothetical protein
MSPRGPREPEQPAGEVNEDLVEFSNLRRRDAPDPETESVDGGDECYSSN